MNAEQINDVKRLLTAYHLAQGHDQQKPSVGLRVESCIQGACPAYNEKIAAWEASGSAPADEDPDVREMRKCREEGLCGVLIEDHSICIRPAFDGHRHLDPPASGGPVAEPCRHLNVEERSDGWVCVDCYADATADVTGNPEDRVLVDAAPSDEDRSYKRGFDDGVAAVDAERECPNCGKRHGVVATCMGPAAGAR